ncbi:ferritin-like domain-containing protein [Chitinophaga flava]|uniref:Aldehyde dehydrogenase n=1 Tax=Chitinophaga flava TaxID=2259036 RepID=A0A365Y476_9BACT|nr:PA2169 family four-helix-bundle protein [Chitinophaga flava]RBL93386.1 aldehyde dehydrogenase [Chitinophaga flava]
MQQQEQLKEILSDLVKINNDRIEGYQQAIGATDDADLKALFQRMIDDSVRYADELNAELLAIGAEKCTGTTPCGKLYHAWTDLKTIFTGQDRHAILSFCEYSEDAAQRAYNSAFKTETSMPYRIRELIADQQKLLQNDHDIINAYRNVQKTVY